MKIYLAGPEVFCIDANALGEQKKALCAQYGFIGLFPLDTVIENAETPRATGFTISDANEALIREADIVVANLTPFRGASADVGTVYELGMARGLGIRTHGYSNDPTLYSDRLLALFGDGQAQVPGEIRDRDGLKIEEFGLHDNLMIDGGLRSNNGYFEIAKKKVAMTDMTTFESLLRKISRSV